MGKNKKSFRKGKSGNPNGAPKKDFQKLTSDKSKRKRVENDNLNQFSLEELLFAAQIKASEKNRDMYKILKIIQEREPAETLNIIEVGIKTISNPPKILTPVQALAVKKQNNLTQRIYTNIRRVCKSFGITLFPAINKVDNERKIMLQNLNPTITQISYTIDVEILIKSILVDILKVLDIEKKNYRNPTKI